MKVAFPVNTFPGYDWDTTSTGCPTFTAAMSFSYTSTSTQTRDRSATLNKGSPTFTYCPSTTSFSITTPGCGV